MRITRPGARLAVGGYNATPYAQCSQLLAVQRSGGGSRVGAGNEAVHAHICVETMTS